jgi:hypothetical protein
VVASVVAALALAGCAGPSSEPQVTPSATSTSSVDNTTHAYQPDGTAFDNKAYFDQVLQPVATAGQPSPSKAMIGALVAAGFDKKAIEATPDLTRTGLDADSVFVAVQMGKLCLIAQRTSSKEYVSSVESALKIGGCLIGNAGN